MNKTLTSMAKPKPGTSRDMFELVRIQADERHVIEFDKIDTRFNDCTNWQVCVSGERVLFSTRIHERFSDVKSGVLATIAVCEGRSAESDRNMLAAAKAMLAVLDKYPSFGALVKHPGVMKNK
ncbi:hypothetical protein [Siccibacter turicensis]|uniref:hypothetical protein n=1 Tax=Siccibacter TaxID=1649298 RepID=UPI001F0E6F5D|nr:hypothetical protein [Siccibacter turicensis]